MALFALLFSLLSAPSPVLCADANIGAPDTELPTLAVYTEQSGVVPQPDGTLSGFHVQIVTEMLRRAGLRWRLQVLPWKRAYLAALETPNVLLFPTSRTREREELFHWLGPMFRVQWIFFRKKDSPLRVETLEDARKVGRIAVYREDARHQYLLAQGFTNLEVVNDTSLGWQMLLSGRVDLLAGSNIPVDQTGFAGQGELLHELEPAMVLRNIELHPVLSLGTDPAIVHACSKALADMVADGGFAAIYRRWFAKPDFSPYPLQP